MKQIVITLVGPDRPGLVETVSKSIFQHQGNWMASSLSKTAGQFAGIIQVQLPADEITPLRTTLDQIDGLKCILHDDNGTTSTQAIRKVKVNVTGNDKPGIVQEVSRAIRQAGGNVIKMATQCESAANWGGELFVAEVIIAVAQEDDDNAIKTALEEIGDDLIVDFDTESN